MMTTNDEIETKWRRKAFAVPEGKRGRDLKGLICKYQKLDELDSILKQHQGPFADLPQAQQNKLLVSLLNIHLVSFEQLHVTEAIHKALPHLLGPHAGLHNNLPITPLSLIKASVAALFYQLHGQPHLVLQTGLMVTGAVEDMLSPEDADQLQALLQSHEPDFGIPELLWVMASMRTHAAMELSHADDADLYRNALQMAYKAGQDMLRHKRDMLVAHCVIGHVLMMDGALQRARLVLEQGIKVADDTCSHYHACLLRFEYAQALLRGGDGQTFRKGDVRKMVSEGDKMYKQLRTWKHPISMSVLEDYRHRVHHLLKACPGYQASPDGVRLQSLRSSLRVESRESARWGVCDGFGSQFPELWTCQACTSVRYCSKKCQKANWQVHKQKCKRIQQETAAQSAG